MKPILYLMMGLPGAGKTTAAKALEEVSGAVRLSSDEARQMLWPNPEFNEDEHTELYEYLNDLTEQLLTKGKSVIYDANLNRKIHRQEKYDLANNLGVECKLLWVQTDQSLAKQRRVEENLTHLVPKNETPHDMFERIAKVMEEPSPDEHYSVLDGTKITSQYVKNQLGL